MKFTFASEIFVEILFLGGAMNYTIIKSNYVSPGFLIFMEFSQVLYAGISYSYK